MNESLPQPPDKPAHHGGQHRCYPPDDVHDQEGWNRYWENEASSKWAGFADQFINDYWLTTLMSKLELRTILSAGNGLSLESHALASAGFHVTAADLSAWAMEFMKKVPLKPNRLRRFFTYPGYLRPSFPPSIWEMRLLWHYNSRCLGSRLFNPARRGGGTLSFLSGDLLDPSFCEGPFDVVIERCTVQLFSNSERDKILERLSARLNPNGIFVSHCHMGWWRPGDPEEHMFESWFREHGFLIHKERVDRSDRPQKNSGRIALLSYSTG